jgi:VIT1/CCC1 family predicted Fe2+/Mn2+ transporter
VDDLDYFPGGTWLSDDDAAYQGYADPGPAWRGDQHYRGGEPDNVWQRQAEGPWSPLGAPVADQVRESGAQPRYREGGWPQVPLGGEPGRPPAASWDTGAHTRPYPSAPPPAGYPRAYGPDPRAPRDSGPQDWLRDSGPRERLRDSGPRERLRETGARDRLRDSGPRERLRDTGARERLRETGARDRLRDSGPQDFGSRRPAEPGDGRSARRHTGTSLIAGYAPDADYDYDDEPRGTASRAASRAPSSAGAPQPSYGRPLPEWLPFGHRLVLLPKEQGAPTLGNLREHRDVSGGWLRPAVFGAMDGVVTNASLIAGIGAGGGAHGMIILTGIAGLIAGAFSMATGEYISVKSQNELTQAEVELERLQHERDRDGKLDRLTQVFMDKGVSPNLAEAVSRQISADPERAVATHVREELGLDPDDLPSPRTAAVASFISFTIGALVPLGPFLLGYPSLQAALVLAGLFAFGGGAVVARLAGRPAFLGGLRQFTAAFLATGMAFFIGHLVGAHIG